MTIFSFTFRLLRKIIRYISYHITNIYSQIILNGNGVIYGKHLKCNGIPVIDVHRTAKMIVGSYCTFNSSINSNPIGRYTPCMFIVRENAQLIIGNKVGISSAAIVCQNSITIENNVKIGGGVCIYDTDFHSIDSNQRKYSTEDFKHKKTSPVLIKENAFIGAHSTILKGVTIGKNSVIGACSVVTTNIQDNEVWAGNPARFIRSI